MGVSAAGKSTVARLIAERIGADFLDADDLHPAANRSKMSAGVPLDDDDRAPWLDRVAREIGFRGDAGVVIACSALRRRYRDRIRAGAPGIRFVHLHGSEILLAERAAARTDHFMPSSLLASQIATLELLDADEDGVVLDVAPAADAVAQAAVKWLDTRSS
ncbi:gluconokinase [Microbacterium sp. NPDC089696]|uniref:gluconokinase n=1 Tax=Microbacterium sp. NPDC089696 TaxID=3364199 RepID=UPI00381DF65A